MTQTVAIGIGGSYLGLFSFHLSFFPLPSLSFLRLVFNRSSFFPCIYLDILMQYHPHFHKLSQSFLKGPEFVFEALKTDPRAKAEAEGR